MPSVAGVAAVRFSNEQIRTLCDKLPAIYAILKHHALMYTDTPGLIAAFPNDPTAVVVDGSPGDGRYSVTGADVVALEAVVASLVGQLEANDRAILKLVLKFAVNPSVAITL